MDRNTFIALAIIVIIFMQIVILGKIHMIDNTVSNVEYNVLSLEQELYPVIDDVHYRVVNFTGLSE